MIQFYEINPAYIDYLVPFASHLFHNRQDHQQNSRKYIGIVLTVNDLDYFVPLSSFKSKHLKMRESVDFIKIRQFAVLNLNNMIPVPKSSLTFVNINGVADLNYRNLLRNEYRIIKVLEKKILRNAQIVYTHKVRGGSETGLSKRCNDFILLEQKAKEYMTK